MRAKDFIAYNKLKFAEELKTTIDRFSDIRKDFSKTDLYYTSHLREPDKWVKFIENCLKKKVDSKKHWDFIQELESCISSDASFTYLFRNLTRKSKEEKNITTAEQIEQYIANQFENYPCHCIDDFLTNQINDNFIKTLDTRDYTEQQELEIFHTAYRLFDDIRQQLQNTRHATHIYKEFKMQTEQMKDDTLRLLSYYVHEYNYDITDYQREKLNAISDHLGRYIQQRYKKHEETNGKWESLKCTIDNMISDDEKLKLLISERTEFLQLSQDKQRLIDPQFAEKCQLEIEKIKEIQSISQKHTETDDENEKSDIKRTRKVTSDTILLLLKELKVTQNADNTAIAAFINYATGFSYEKIRQQLSNTEELTLKHKKEVDFVNELLQKLNINKSINYNKNR